MRANVKTKDHTHEGGRASVGLTIEQQLRRSLLSCFLSESTFYEDGQSIADRIKALAMQCDPATVAAMAKEARHSYHLRHAPLLLLLAIAETKAGRAHLRQAIKGTIGRPDEMGELLARYYGSGSRSGKKMPNAMRKGLRDAFEGFNAYSLTKYLGRDSGFALRDVMFLAHPKAVAGEMAELYKSIADGTAKAPDTWEVALSGGADKKETFTRLIEEKKLGYMALLRNLRNMAESGVSEDVVRSGMQTAGGFDKVLPFRFVAAARACPRWEQMIDEALLRKVEAMPSLKGTTVVLVDVSGSMNDMMSGKSDLTRMDAAAALASVVKSESLRVFTFSDKVVEIPPRRGMAGIDVVVKSQDHHGTQMGAAVKHINDNVPYDRLIVVTDEQTSDKAPAPKGKGYIVNVAPYRAGVGYGSWTKVDGFSERVLEFIAELESSEY